MNVDDPIAKSLDSETPVADMKALAERTTEEAKMDSIVRTWGAAVLRPYKGIAIRDG
jgi:hypothetical protein